MSTSTNLLLPFLAAGQAQKHVTVNESLLRLDALVQLSVVSSAVTTQPASPSDGALYILPAGKTGAAWGAMANGALAYYRDGAWEEIAPLQGWLAFDRADGRTLVYDGAAWIAPLGASGALPFYEEGVFTPTLSFQTPGDLALTYAAQVGAFVRIGNLIYAHGRVATSAFTWTTASGNLVIGGMPFTSANDGTANYGIGIYGGVTKSGFTDFLAFLNPNSNQLFWRAQGSGVANASVVAADIPSGGTTTLAFSISYRRS
jgi:hypothetical protein